MKPSGFFETHPEKTRQALKIPGMSAAVVRNQELIWASGFGYSDLENKVAATPDTPYGLASVTKPVAGVGLVWMVRVKRKKGGRKLFNSTI